MVNGSKATTAEVFSHSDNYDLYVTKTILLLLPQYIYTLATMYLQCGLFLFHFPALICNSLHVAVIIRRGQFSLFVPSGPLSSVVFCKEHLEHSVK